MTVTAHYMPRKPAYGPPEKQKVNEEMVGKARRIRHRLILGGIERQMIGWSKDESSYSAGSLANATIPISADFQLLTLYQEHLEGSNTPMTIDIRTTIDIKGKRLFDDILDFSGVITSVKPHKKLAVYVISASSWAQVLQMQKVNEIIASKATQAKTTTDVVTEFTKEYGQGLNTTDAQGNSTVDAFETTVGTIYKEQAVHAAVNISVWDLFSSFAEKDGANLYVLGNTLYYQLKATDKNPGLIQNPPNIATDYTFTYGSNVLDLEIEHMPIFAHDITVTVKSYQPHSDQTYARTRVMSPTQITKLTRDLEKYPNKFQLAFEQSQQKMNKGRKTPPKVVTSGKLIPAKKHRFNNYVFVVPNVTTEDCDRIAAQIAQDISRKEFLVTLTVLGQPDFNPQQIIRLVNTGEDASDQAYCIKNVKTSCGEMPAEGGTVEGYVTVFTLVNHAVQTTGTSLGV